MKALEFERILIGLDGKGVASDAVARGLSLARKSDARVKIVHAVEVPVPPWPGTTDADMRAREKALVGHARAECERAIGLVQPSTGYDAQTPAEMLELVPGHAARTIVNQAADWKADLIVIGPHEKRGFFDLGSTARGVHAFAPCPVWTQKGSAGDVEKILVPVDFSDASRVALDWAQCLAGFLGASLDVLHCHPTPVFGYSNLPDAALGPTYVIDNLREQAQEELERWIKDRDWGALQVKSTFLEGSVLDRAPVASEEADLVVMGAHGRAALSRFLLGSVTYSMLKRASTSIAVVPTRTKKVPAGGADSETDTGAALELRATGGS